MKLEWKNGQDGHGFETWMFQIPKQEIEMEWAKALAQIPDKIKHEPAKAPDYGELNQAFYQANKPLFTI